MDDRFNNRIDYDRFPLPGSLDTPDDDDPPTEQRIALAIKAIQNEIDIQNTLDEASISRGLNLALNILKTYGLGS